MAALSVTISDAQCMHKGKTWSLVVTPRKKRVFCPIFEGMEPEVGPYTGLVPKLQDVPEPFPCPNLFQAFWS